jgi:hypothetical protein
VSHVVDSVMVLAFCEYGHDGHLVAVGEHGLLVCPSSGLLGATTAAAVAVMGGWFHEFSHGGGILFGFEIVCVGG